MKGKQRSRFRLIQSDVEVQISPIGLCLWRGRVRSELYHIGKNHVDCIQREKQENRSYMVDVVAPSSCPKNVDAQANEWEEYA